MLCSIKNRDDSKNTYNVISLQDQVKALGLQDNLGKQNLHEDMKKVFEPVTEPINDVSQDVTKSVTETSYKNNKALEKLNDRLSEIMKNRGILASYLLSAMFKITNPNHTSQFKLLKDPKLNRLNVLLIKKTITVTLNINLLLFRDTDKKN